MPRRGCLLLSLVVIALGAWAVPLAAQTDLPIDPHYTIRRFPNWTVTDYEVGFVLSGGRYTVYVVDPAELRENLDPNRLDSATDILLWAYTWFYPDDPHPDADDVEVLEFDGRAAYAYHHVHAAENFEGLMLLLTMSDGSYGLLDITAYLMYYGNPAEDIDILIASFDSVAAVTATPTRGRGIGGTITPAAGTWRLTFDETYTRACQGIQEIEVLPVDEVFSLTSYLVTIERATGGILVDGEFYPRTPGTNRFEHTTDFDDGYAFQEFNFDSPTSATGTLIGYRPIDGLLCSGTATFTFTRIR